MKPILYAALISGTMTVAGLTITPPAFAGVGISVDFGDVAVGYRDGYYDSDHHWHHWRHSHDWRDYSHAHPDHFHAYNHTRDHGH